MYSLLIKDIIKINSKCPNVSFWILSDLTIIYVKIYTFNNNSNKKKTIAVKIK